MTEICILRPLDQPWLHRQGEGSTFQGLYPGFLIRTDDMPTLLGDGWRMLVDFTHRRHLGGKRNRVLRLGVEPVFYSMGL